MEQISTTGREPGSAIPNNRFNFTATYSGIKASIVSVLMWLSVIGGALL